MGDAAIGVSVLGEAEGVGQMLPEFCTSVDASTVSEAKQTQCDVHRLQASERGYVC